MKLVLAPHVVSEDHLKEIEGKLRRPFARYSRVTEESAARADCLIIDGYGLLSSIYRYGEMAYVAAVSAWASITCPRQRYMACPCLSARTTASSVRRRICCARAVVWR